MRKYIKFATVQMQVNSAYSAWFWANIASILLRLFITYYFWQAVYSQKSSIEGMQANDMITYTIVAMFMSMFVTGVSRNLAGTIRDGNVAVELMRPYHLISRVIAMDAGDKIVFFIRGALPLCLFAYFFLDISLPDSWNAALLFLASAFLGIFVGTFFDLLIGILAFWTVNVWGLEVMKEAVIAFFSGAIVPLILFPEWLQTLSIYLPFQAMVYVPVSIYTGMLSGTEAYMAIGIQLIWAVSLLCLMNFLWSIAVKKVTIFGG